MSDYQNSNRRHLNAMKASEAAFKAYREAQSKGTLKEQDEAFAAYKKAYKEFQNS